jgi:hypothetical protein
VAELALIFITNRRRHKHYEKYEYKTIPNSESDSDLQLTTCRRCKGDVYNNVWTGYQTGASPPPPSYWPDSIANSGVQTKSWQNYKVTGSPVENTHYQNCDDNYRCRQYGISTGVQGKIF